MVTRQGQPAGGNPAFRAAKQQQDARLAQHRGEQNRQRNQNNRLQRQEPPAAISDDEPDEPEPDDAE